jgi:hypothetical protein
LLAEFGRDSIHKNVGAGQGWQVGAENPAFMAMARLVEWFG